MFDGRHLGELGVAGAAFLVLVGLVILIARC
jgi:hypothetical protein